MSHANDHHSDDEHGHHLHVTPFWPMLIVFVILLFLTALTVWTAKDVHAIHIGNTTIEIGETPHLLIALTIAVVKSALVLGFFMHLLYDKAVNTIILASTLFAIMLFLGLTLMDIAVRDSIDAQESGEIVSGGPSQIVEKAIVREEAVQADRDHAHEGDHDEEHHDDDHDEDHAEDTDGA